MLRLFISLLFRLGADQRGAVLIKFTVALLPLLTVVGVAVDVGQVFLVKQKLTNAVDAAGIAVGRHSELDEDEVKALAQSFVVAHYPATAIGDLKGVTVTALEKQVDVTATASVPMTFLTILGYKSVDITASTMVLRQLRKIELVMVLDNSGSMAGTRMTALQSSANALITALFGSETTSNFVKIGLAPFSSAVNVGAGNAGADWIDSTGLSILHKEDVDLPLGKTLFDLLGSLTNASWGGCVRARLSGYDLTDEPPDAGESLFVPYIAPNEPTGCYVNGKFVLASKFACTGTYLDYANDYLSNANTVGFTPQQNQRNWLAYVGKTVPAGGTLGPNYNCPASPIQPLTNVKSTITSAISSMVAYGNTVIPEGIAWGWRVLSPGPPFTEGAPYSDPDTLKFLILLTDGENNVGAPGNYHNSSSFSAFGFAASGHLGNTDGSQARAVLDAKTATLCGNVKAQGIYLYTIALQVSDSATRKMLEDCATPPADCPGKQCYYNSPTASDLETAFTNIALGINKLRVAQ
ncbi:MAG TPA: pilus assembly protein TadG-related protein [Hyphomicrobiaceae bacterium]|jgi:Flp pilus assembly protein TadG|nr:pilus assembly protein TadG-related protein [Hyphomicrobiaceae bacterium]